MLNVEEIILTALQLAGRGDRPSEADKAKALKHLQIILDDWAATKGVLLWNVTESGSEVPRGDVVLVGETYYQCYSSHLSNSTNEPATGADWPNFWVECKPSDDATTWATATTYENRRAYADQTLQVEDILGVTVQHAGQFSNVEKIGSMEFAALPLNVTGVPEKLWVQKTIDGLVFNLYPLPDVDDAKFFFYTIKRPPTWTLADDTNMASQWVQALYYALAVELGFLYNIDFNRLNVIGQKAEFEFAKAFRTNESELDECFIKPLY